MIRIEMEKPKESAQKFKWTQRFDSPKPINPELLGKKGANLAEMTSLGLPVPPGFTLTTETWQRFNQEGELPPEIWQETLDQLALLAIKTGKKFGDPDNPLVVSVRSGAFYSMPGMMDTVLNIGLTQETMPGLKKQIGPATAKDSYQRLKVAFEEITGEDPPQDHCQQLRIAIEAVFASWNNPRAIAYRRYNAIPEAAGTAATIQEMVFGNIEDHRSGAGVFFTRDPRTGEKRATGEFVLAGQGEDVVQEKRKAKEIPFYCLRILETYGDILEEHFRAAVDIEWTKQGKDLFLLQSRALQGTPLARARIAHNLAKEGLISQQEAYQRVKPADREAILRPGFEEKAVEKARKKSLLGQGKAASIGAAVGSTVFTPQKVREARPSHAPILVCRQADPNDIATLRRIEALVTSQGGTASHMALILQVLGKAAVVGVEWKKRPKEGETISVNGATGEVFKGKVPLAKKVRLSPEMKRFMEEWQKTWGESVWASALYPAEEKYSRQTFLEKIATLKAELDQSPSRKAQTTILLNHVIPQEAMIQSVVVRPDDLQKMRRVLESISQQNGFQAIPRSCYYPEELISPWATIPDATAIEDFLTNPDFPGKYGGLVKWQQTPGLTSIIIPAEPEGKLDPELAPEHFAATISCLPSQPPKVIVDLQLEEAHLRGFEEIKPENLIQIIAPLNYDSPYYLGQIEVDFGERYQGNPYAEEVTQIIKETVFQKWWRPPFSLPHLMAALAETYGLSVLEVQGRMKEKESLAWGPLVYGAKGREEEEKALQFSKKRNR